MDGPAPLLGVVLALRDLKQQLLQPLEIRVRLGDREGVVVLRKINAITYILMQQRLRSCQLALFETSQLPAI